MKKIADIRALLCVLAFAGSASYAAGDGQQNMDTVLAPSSVLSGTLFLDAMAVGDALVAVGERGQILLAHTGRTWQLVTAPVAATLTAVWFHDDKLGWAAGHDAVILKTMDGGRHWQQVYSDPGRNSPILDIWFADKDYGIAIGAYGLYLVTTNGGRTWVKDELHVVNVVNRDIQDTVRAAPQAATVARVGDGPSDLHLNGMAGSGSGKLYIAAEAGHLYRSDDLGRTWLELPSPYQGSLFGVLPLAQDSLLVYGLRGHLYRSDDGGQSWSRIETRINDNLTGGIILHDGNIVLTGMGGVVLTSRDGGRTFAARELRYQHDYAAVMESGNGDVIVAGDHGLENLGRKDIGLAHE